VQTLLGHIERWLAYSQASLEDCAGEKEIMAWKKNADGILQYHYKFKKVKTKKIQKDWLKEHGYKRNTFPPQFFEKIEENLTPIKRGYWAYAIDGDGWVSVYKKRKLTIGIELKDLEPIQELADIYGTSISRKEFPNEKWADLYVTIICGKRALHFLRLICPYMTEKRKKATECINTFDSNYHPPKISMNFRKNPNLLCPHMGMVAGFFDTEGSVGITPREQKKQTKKFGERIYSFLNAWLDFSNTDTRPLRKIKKILETWPFNFNCVLRVKRIRSLKKNGEISKPKYELSISSHQHLLFMKMFSPWILITRKREYAEKFEIKKQISEMCKR
jgi:hypothetical protein